MALPLSSSVSTLVIRARLIITKALLSLISKPNLRREVMGHHQLEKKETMKEHRLTHQAKLAAASATLSTPELPPPPPIATSAASDSTFSPKSPAPPVNTDVSSASSPALIVSLLPPPVVG